MLLRSEKRWAAGPFVLLALLFTAVAPVHAAPRALSRTSDLLALAPAGEHVLVARVQGRNLRVFAIPLSGGQGRQVFSFVAPAGLRPEGAALAASAQRAALTIEMGGQPDRVSAVQTFGGPLEGGWSELQPFTRTGSRDAVSPLRQQVDGDRIFTTESHGDDVRVVVRDPDPREVPFAPGESASSATFAGDLVATVRNSGDGDSNVLVVRDWRTGAVVNTADLQDGVNAIALRPDGRAAVITYQGALYEMRPGAPPRRLAGVDGSKTAYAGDSLVFEAGDGLRIIDADGRIRRLGMPTWTFGGFSAAGSRVVWVANGCLLVDDAGAPPAAAPDPGPCLRSEISLASRTQPDLYLADTLPVTVRCVAAPRACRGALRLTTGRSARATAISRRVRFSIPAGQTRRIRVPLTCRGYRTMRRTLARESSVIVDLDARTGDGQRYLGDLWYGMSWGPAEAIARCPGITAGRSRLPDSIDVGPLRGDVLPGTRCEFARKVDQGSPIDGNVRLGLDCRLTAGIGVRGAVSVERVQSGHDFPEDSVHCVTERDRDPSAAPLFSCELWHGKLRLFTLAWCARDCNAGWKTRAQKAARATLTKIVERISILPEQPCRLCPSGGSRRWRAARAEHGPAAQRPAAGAGGHDQHHRSGLEGPALVSQALTW